MPLFAKVNGAQKEMTNAKVKVGGEWKQAVEIMTKVNGKWVRAWKSNYIAFNVYHETTSSYANFEDYYDNVSQGIDLNGVVIQAFDSSGNVLGSYTGNLSNISSIDLNVYDADGNMLGDVMITPHRSFNKIQYSMYITDVSRVSRLSISVAVIYTPDA